VALGFAGVRSYVVEDQWNYQGFTPAAGGGGHSNNVVVRLSRGRMEWDFQRERDLSIERSEHLYDDGSPVASVRQLEHRQYPSEELSLAPNSLGAWAGRLGWGFVAWQDAPRYYFADLPLMRSTSFLFPLWFPTLLLAILLALWLRRRMILRKRSRLGFCKTCGYDLRATPQRCPECGTVAAAPAAAAG